MSTRTQIPFQLVALAALAVLGGGAAASKGSPNAAASDPAVAFIADLPIYEPSQRVSGTVVLWGHGSFKHDFMGPLVKRWISGLQKTQPGIALDFRMYGTASAISALFTGAGNLAILGEEISPSANRAFERAKGYSPTRIDVATGSLETNFFDYAHMIFVHKDNPLDRLTLQQLDAVFGAEHRRGGRNIRSWGELGLKGPWGQAPIQPYGWKVDEDFALFFREAVLQNSHRWNNAIKEFVHVVRADGTQYDHGQQILDALAKDPRGIAVSNVRYQNPGVKPIALAREPGGPFIKASNATLISQEYPLVRIIPAYVDKSRGGRVEPAVREFLRYVLSREGQRALIEESGYLPLGSRAIAAQLERLQ
jgi:phosphate transport system substrate-binding protein